MTVFATKVFARFARKEGLRSEALLTAVDQVATDRWDADLGGGLFKQRIARPGGGKSGGYRVIIVFKRGAHSFFLHGFAKSERENISEQDLKRLKGLATILLSLDAEGLRCALVSEDLLEIDHDQAG